MRIPGFAAPLPASRTRALPQRVCLACCLTAAAAVLTGLGPSSARAADPPGPPSLAIYAGGNLPIDGLAWFAEAAVDPTKATDADLAALKERGVRPIALLDGEKVRATHDGRVLFEALTKRGFVGYLFDGRKSLYAPQVEALLLEARRTMPQSILYFRGPAARLPAIGPVLSGYVTDGIFTEPAPAEGEMTPPTMLDDLEGVRRLASLVEVKRRYRFPFIVAERVPVGYREQARGIARTLADRGFTPYVTIGGRGLGIGFREYIPRRIMALYDGNEEPYIPATLIHRNAPVTLEYFGFILEYVDIRKPLPAGDLASRYAGIVSWFVDDEMAQPRTYERWLETQIANGLRIAMLNRPGFDATPGFLRKLGIVESSKKLVGPVSVAASGKMIGFETRPTPQVRGLLNWRATTGEVHLELRDASGQTVTPVVTGSWGGVAMAPFMIDLGYEDRIRWIVDPFAFITRALDVEPMPVPDTTTENGRRILFIHIDGDAFASMAEMPGKFFSGQIIMRDFLEKYPFPTTVSVIEGETAKSGVYPQLSERLEVLAKEMFALPNVEPASHGYSHPYDWVRAARGEAAAAAGSKDPVHLPIPGYKYSAQREVGGSLRYISERLTPVDKPAKVFLWSGAALPEPDAMKEIVAGKYFNMNGGNGELPVDAPTLSMVTSLGRPVDGMLQIYSQEQNENVYTNEWRGPFYGFRRVIGSFKYTDSPRRLKPINIYYHFYSGTKLASINALQDVYQYAASQDTVPIYVSEACTRIEDYFRMNLARRLDGNWELRSSGALRTVRLDKRLGWPNIVDSQEVVGVEDIPQGRYVALSGAQSVTLALQANRPTVPHLVSANVPVVSWSRDRETVKFRLKGHMPVDMTIGGCSPSSSVGNARLRVDSGKRTARLTFPSSDTREVTLSCR
jgi:polysaccharide biosynthesis protein PelA